MATGRKTVAPGQVVASDWGNTVWDQSVQQFASAADRSTQFPAPKKGAMSWLDDKARPEWWDGTAWIPAGPPPRFTYAPPTIIGNPAPPDNQPMMMFAASVVNTSNASGDVTMNFPPFPNALVTSIVVGGDAGIDMTPIMGASSLSSAWARAVTPAGVTIANTVIRFNFLVIGW